jgi:hypothetical protein
VQGAQRGVERLDVRGRVREQLFLRLQRGVLVGVLQPRGVDLLELEAEEVELARTRPRVATE